MDDLAMLIQAMDLNPEELTPRRMFVDALMERTGCSLQHAKTVAYSHYHSPLVQLHIGRAVGLTIGKGSVARRLQWCISKACQTEYALTERILITAGEVAPVYNPSPLLWAGFVANEPPVCLHGRQAGEQLTARPQPPFIVVGSMWVLRVAHEWKFLDVPPAPEELPECDEY